LCQGADEDLLITIGDIVYPGFITRHPNKNGIRLQIEGDPNDPTSKAPAMAMFQILLGALRAFRAEAGELQTERAIELGMGSVEDEAGNQWVAAGTIRVFTMFGGEVEFFATNLRAAIDNLALRDALWLNGRPGRTGADYYMIHEYAKRDLGGEKGVRYALGISRSDQERLTASANNLPPLEGGRHATGTGSGEWNLQQMRAFTANLIKRWIGYRAHP
jgi:hypothetical protein